MTRRNRRSMFLVFAIALGLGAASGCTGRVLVSGTATTGVVYTEPPPPQVETQVVVRPGHIWVKGHYDWRNNQWAWIGGHWERERGGYAWTDGHWERRGNAWHWIEGKWIEGSVTVRDNRERVEVRDNREHVEVRDNRDHGGHGGHGGGTVVIDVNADYPNVEPPALQDEDQGPPQPRLVWVRGNWNWQRGKGWIWIKGHWERPRAGKTWVDAKWELRGGRWTFVDGGWR